MSDNWEHAYNDEELDTYVRGQASDTLTQAIERDMAVTPALRAEIALLRGIRPALEKEAPVSPPGELGWRRLEAALSDAPQERLLQNRATPNHWRVAAIALGIAVIAQGALLLMPKVVQQEARFHTASQADEGFELAVAFEPDAQIATVATLLANAGAQIVDGPSAAGLYRIRFETAEAWEAGKTLLDAAPAVSFVAQP
ncbi:hypothetical protein [Shimia sp. MMG029]|uniref:hypothetical protein n=1 Tax=Shimia sp. MMG029 TaxID=3021978 RepID=UPI0022FF2822|nr:hypothetical protein [Shimia sp. MMG029]MDA5555810.1 hypothetical protein [Shimia sp. MMG029]